MDGEAFGRALAVAIGDLRDWPARCPEFLGGCGSENLEDMLGERDTFRCRDCGIEATGEVIAHDRRERAARDTGIRRTVL